MANDLLIKINADASNVKKEFDNLRAQTADLESSLKGAALISGAAFAAFTAEIFISVHAFEEAQKSAVQLTAALQNQGIYTKELEDSYKSFADTVQAKTGIDNDAIIKAQALAQTFLGQTKITEQLTFAIADLGASMGGDLNSAAEKIARTIGTGTNAFARQGLVISATATEAERMAKVLEFVQSKAGGLAAEFNKADGYTQALATSFGNLQEAIGSKFAPIFATVRQSLVQFFDYLSNNPAIVSLIASFLTAGVVVTGLATLLTAGAGAFLILSAAATAAGFALNFALLGIPIAIAAVTAAVVFLALNWDASMQAIKASAVQVITLLSELFSGFGKILAGAFTLDPGKIEAGLKQIQNSFAASQQAARDSIVATTAVVKEEGEKQDAAKKAQADREAEKKRQHQANLVAIEKANLQLINLQNENASSAIIALKSKELETLKALDQEKSDAEIALLRTRQRDIKGLQEQQQAEDLERETAFTDLLVQTRTELATTTNANEAAFRAERLEQIRASNFSEADADRQLQETLLTSHITARNQELLDKKKYGVTYAAINKALSSDEVKAAGDAAGSLVALSQSKNAQLKDIGKAAAVTQIGIDTAKGAMAVYANFQTAIPYPPVSIPLGLAAAAALTLYGAERVGTVLSAAHGGLVEGGIPGRDSVPALLAPGELVVPRKNFNEVVGAASGASTGPSNEEMLAVLHSIDNKFSNPQTTVIQGDVQSDDSYIDSLVRKISDAIEFRNGQIFGVTA